MFIPSGEQIELRCGDLRATVVEVGGGIRSLTSGNFELLAGYAVGECAYASQGMPLIPWPNRIRDGRYFSQGQNQQLPLSEPVRHNAIHGLTRWLNWTWQRQDAGTVTLRQRLRPQPGYPFALDIAIGYELSDGGLRVSTSVTNIGTQAAPFGNGFHPYFSAGEGVVDNTMLQLQSRTRLICDSQMIPTGESAVVAGTEWDFRAGKRVENLALDTAFADLDRDPGGRANIRFEPPTGPALKVWMDRGYGWVMLYTPESRRSLAIEPMTCPPDAFNSGTGLVVLEPAQTHSSTWGIAVLG